MLNVADECTQKSFHRHVADVGGGLSDFYFYHYLGR